MRCLPITGYGADATPINWILAMSDTSESYLPTVQELDELAKALAKFVWDDERSSYGYAYQQESHRLPAFVHLGTAKK